MLEVVSLIFRHISPFIREVRSVDSDRLNLDFSAFDKGSDMGCGTGDSSEQRGGSKKTSD